LRTATWSTTMLLASWPPLPSASIGASVKLSLTGEHCQCPGWASCGSASASGRRLLRWQQQNQPKRPRCQYRKGHKVHGSRPAWSNCSFEIPLSSSSLRTRTGAHDVEIGVDIVHDAARRGVGRQEGDARRELNGGGGLHLLVRHVGALPAAQLRHAGRQVCGRRRLRAKAGRDST